MYSHCSSTLRAFVWWRSIQPDLSVQLTTHRKNIFWYREITLQTIIPPIGAEETTDKRAHPFLPLVKMSEPYSGLHCSETEIDTQ